MVLLDISEKFTVVNTLYALVTIVVTAFITTIFNKYADIILPKKERVTSFWSKNKDVLWLGTKFLFFFTLIILFFIFSAFNKGFVICECSLFSIIVIDLIGFLRKVQSKKMATIEDFSNDIAVTLLDSFRTIVNYLKSDKKNETEKEKIDDSSAQ